MAMSRVFKRALWCALWTTVGGVIVSDPSAALRFGRDDEGVRLDGCVVTNVQGHPMVGGRSMVGVVNVSDPSAALRSGRDDEECG